MKNIIFIFLGCALLQQVYAQTNYKNGNDAYMNERLLGFNPVVINSGGKVFVYDADSKQCKCDDLVLIPDRTATPNGNTIDIHQLFGYGLGGSITDTAFQWDNASISASNTFDRINMFVSPLSPTAYSYGQTMQLNASPCNYGDCFAIVDGPAESLAYPEHSPCADTFNLWAGEDLINAGMLKGTSLDQMVSQQQTDSTANTCYCVQQYGHGWRLPTDMEVGHINDDCGTGMGLDSAYMGITPIYIWTSSLYIVYAVKRWTVRVTDGNWENCNGFLYVPNTIRCVFAGIESTPTRIQQHISSRYDISLFPNPCKNYIVISTIPTDHVTMLVELYNLDGSLIKSISNTAFQQQITFDVHDIPSGMYLIKTISDTRKIQFHKLIITQ